MWARDRRADCNGRPDARRCGIARTSPPRPGQDSPATAPRLERESYARRGSRCTPAHPAIHALRPVRGRLPCKRSQPWRGTRRTWPGHSNGSSRIAGRGRQRLRGLHDNRNTMPHSHFLPPGPGHARSPRNFPRAGQMGSGAWPESPGLNDTNRRYSAGSFLSREKAGLARKGPCGSVRDSSRTWDFADRPFSPPVRVRW
jgi:hypothetical protein